MSGEKKSGEELLEEPQFTDFESSGNTPFDTTMSALMVTGDKELELMCRANQQIAEAASVAYNMRQRFHSKYIAGKIELIERLSVSLQGRGRSEVVQSLQAGSGVPGEFYENDRTSIRGFSEE